MGSAYVNQIHIVFFNTRANLIVNRRSRQWFITILAFSTIMASKTKGSADVIKPTMAAQAKTLAKGNLGFCLNVYQSIAKQADGGDNVFFSPFSVTVALQMTHVGARNETAQQLKEIMKLEEFKTVEEMHGAFSGVLRSFSPDQKLPFTLHTANRMYVQERYEIETNYVQALTQHYLTEATKADFVNNAEKTREGINRWVEETTHQKIKNLIPQGSLNELTRLVLVNAVYFKGDWAKKFDPKATRESEFHRKKNDIIKANFMHQKAKFPYKENYDLNCKIIELSYVGDRLAMFVLLPTDVEGIGKLENDLTPDVLKSLISSMREQKVGVALPKFKLDLGLSLKDVLKDAGIQKLFSPCDADLTGISSKGDLYVSDVFHKAFVDVNEEGTEAAAATAMVLMARSFVMEPEFIADHPFLFLIYDKHSELVLFMGRLTNPPTEVKTDKVEL